MHESEETGKNEAEIWSAQAASFFVYHHMARIPPLLQAVGVFKVFIQKMSYQNNKAAPGMVS